MQNHKSNHVIIYTGDQFHSIQNPSMHDLFGKPYFNQMFAITHHVSTNFLFSVFKNFGLIDLTVDQSSIPSVQKGYSKIKKYQKMQNAVINGTEVLSSLRIHKYDNTEKSSIFLLCNPFTSHYRVITGTTGLTNSDLGPSSKHLVKLHVFNGYPNYKYFNKTYLKRLNDNEVALRMFNDSPSNVPDHSNRKLVNKSKKVRQTKSSNNKENYQIGITALKKGNYSTAISHLWSAASQLKSVKTFLYLGDSLYYQSQQPHHDIVKLHKTSAKAYMKGLNAFNAQYGSSKSDIPASIFDAAGLCCYHLHNFNSAKLYFTNAINSDSKTAKYWSHVGKIDIMRNPKMGIQDFNNASELAPLNSHYYRLLSKAYEDVHNHTEAAHSMNLAKTVNPKLHVKVPGQASVRYDPNLNYTQKLNHMIGLTSVKHTLSSIINQATMFKIRRGKAGHSQIHLLFEGNPGTGKTTVADLLCGILYQRHVIDKYKLVKVNGTQLTSKYFGSGPILVRKAIKKALGGVLFIDEAYQLAHRPDGDSALEDEAMREFIPDIERYNDNLVVIMAGYTNAMEKFINHSNPGLRSRFPNSGRVAFPDYKPDECWKIFKLYLNKHHFKIVSTRAKSLLKKHMTKVITSMTSDNTFANARTIRNIYSDLIHAFSNRMTSKYSIKQLYQLKKQNSPKLNHISLQDVRQII